MKKILILFVFLISSCAKPLVVKTIQPGDDLLNCTELKQEIEEVKKITGYSIGGVSPIGLSKSIKLIIDTSLRRFDKIWSAAGHPHCVFSASFSQLKDITCALETEKLTE